MCHTAVPELFLLAFNLERKFLSSSSDSIFVFALKSKCTNKFPPSFIVQIFNSMPDFDLCLPIHLKCNSALLFSQLIILLCFKENWKLTSELHWKNIKHLLCNVITNYLLSILYLTPANLSFPYITFFILDALCTSVLRCHVG